MLTSLSIKNYALIEEALIKFVDGFTVITGETGAGKSILLGALGLITGKRADSSSIGDPSQKCIIEGVFDIANYRLQSFFESNNLDYESATIVRREILPSGKSRAFINDTPVTLQQLSLLGDTLIDIHSQHKTLDVVGSAYQYEVLDTFANAQGLLALYRTSFKDLKEKEKELCQLQEKKERAQLEFDYQQFLFNELDEAGIKEDEFEQLELSLKTLSHAEEIGSQLSESQQLLSRDDLGIMDLLATVRTNLQVISKYAPSYELLAERINSLFIELDDVGQELEKLSGQVEVNPSELERVNARVQFLYNLMKKHKVDDTAALLQLRNRLDRELQSVLNVGDEILNLEEAIAFAKAETKNLAARLYKKRSEAIPQLQSSVTQILRVLGMENASFEVSLNVKEEMSQNGSDVLAFLFSANVGMPVKVLGKGASGGELSRVMLAVKAILSKRKQLPTLIFDEIDTGVSGEVGVRMGAILKKMGAAMQLMSITHLPQIAGQGSSHYKVYKQEVGGRTQTKITLLSEDERIVEIAEMLGGAQRSEAAMQHAKNLLN